MMEDFVEKEDWLKKAVEESPDRREGYVELAKLYYENNRWFDCLDAAESALEITEKPLEYLCEEFAWGSDPWDYAAIAAYRLGLSDKAVQYGTKAVELNPNDPRLTANLAFYSKEQSLGDDL